MTADKAVKRKYLLCNGKIHLVPNKRLIRKFPIHIVVLNNTDFNCPR